MKNITQDLTLAISKLHKTYTKDPESFHLALSIVFSSIFNYYGCKVVIVGGQAAAYWLRISSSTDIDFVSENADEVICSLEEAGFIVNPERKFQFIHSETDALIEIVSEKLEISGIETVDIKQIHKEDIEGPIVKELMKSSAFVIDPLAVFINYLESSTPDSIWYDYGNNSTYAMERAEALFSLYGESYIRKNLHDNQISSKIKKLIKEKFKIIL